MKIIKLWQNPGNYYCPSHPSSNCQYTTRLQYQHMKYTQHLHSDEDIMLLAAVELITGRMPVLHHSDPSSFSSPAGPTIILAKNLSLKRMLKHYRKAHKTISNALKPL